MDTVRKIPAILALGAGVLTGLSSMAADMPVRERMIRMTAALAIFWVVGLIVRRTTVELMASVEAKRENDRLEAEALLRLQAEEAERERKAHKKGSSIDLTTPEAPPPGSGADYNPIPVSEFIRRELDGK